MSREALLCNSDWASIAYIPSQRTPFLVNTWHKDCKRWLVAVCEQTKPFGCVGVWPWDTCPFSNWVSSYLHSFPAQESHALGGCLSRLQAARGRGSVCACLPWEWEIDNSSGTCDLPRFLPLPAAWSHHGHMRKMPCDRTVKFYSKHCSRPLILLSVSENLFSRATLLCT